MCSGKTQPGALIIRSILDCSCRLCSGLACRTMCTIKENDPQCLGLPHAAVCFLLGVCRAFPVCFISLLLWSPWLPRCPGLSLRGPLICFNGKQTHWKFSAAQASFSLFLFFSIYSTASFVHWNVVFFYSPALRGLLLLIDRRQLQEPFFTGLSGRLHVSTPTYRPPILTSVSARPQIMMYAFLPTAFVEGCGGLWKKRKQDIFQRKLVIWWRTQQQRPLGRRARSCSVGQVLAASL